MFVKFPKLWQNFEKIGFGKLPARAKFRRRGVKRNWKAYQATVDPIVSSKKRQTHAVNSKKRKWKTKLPKVCICESPKIVADFWENLGSGWKAPKLWQIFGKISLGKLRARAPNSEDTFLNSTERLTRQQRARWESNPDRPWPTVLHLLSGTLTGEKRNFPKKWNFPKK